MFLVPKEMCGIFLGKKAPPDFLFVLLGYMRRDDEFLPKRASDKLHSARLQRAGIFMLANAACKCDGLFSCSLFWTLAQMIRERAGAEVK